jgi:hypothetical protein
MHIEHFEELWEKCEKLHQQAGTDASTEVLINELTMKINLYQAVDVRTELSTEDRQMAKSRIMGEILLTLTHMSLKDNINVFEALGVAHNNRSVDFFSQKYQPTT